MENRKLKVEKKIKKYTSPEFEVVEIGVADIITTSPGTETDIMDETDGSWEVGVGLGS